jgi:hypothetical protein
MAVQLRPSCRLAGTRLLPPNRERLGPVGAVLGGAHAMPERVAVLVDGAVGGEELLRLPG